MYDSGFSTGALIFTRLPSITPTTPGNPPSALKLSIVSLNWVPGMGFKKKNKLDCVLRRDQNYFEQVKETFLIREQTILLFGHLMYWFLKASTLSVTRRTTLETLLNVTLNRSAISRVVSWFAMHHKKIETCFRASITCLPNGFPTGSNPVPTTSLTKISKVVLFRRKWLWNSSTEYKGTVCSKYPWHRFKLLRAINAVIENMGKSSSSSSIKWNAKVSSSRTSNTTANSAAMFVVASC